MHILMIMHTWLYAALIYTICNAFAYGFSQTCYMHWVCLPAGSDILRKKPEISDSICASEQMDSGVVVLYWSVVEYCFKDPVQLVW